MENTNTVQTSPAYKAKLEKLQKINESPVKYTIRINERKKLKKEVPMVFYGCHLITIKQPKMD